MIKYFKYWKFNHEENLYFDSIIKTFENNRKEKITLIQLCHDLNLSHNFQKIVSNNESDYFECIAPNISYYSFCIWGTIIPRIAKDFSHFMIRREWKKLYKKFGINHFYDSNQLSKKIKFKNFWKALKFFSKLKSHKSLLDHYFNGIKCGDLIYDSFLRFAKKPTVTLKDFTLLLFIYDCYNQVEYFQSLAKRKKIVKYYSSYSTYISHGIPVRVFLDNQIEVFVIGYSTFNNFKIKKLSRRDNSQVSPHWSYRSIFKDLQNKNQLVDLGIKKLENRLNGKENLDYMKTNQYKADYKFPFESKFDGVVFIGDFTDAQHIYRTLVYRDLYVWFLDTARIVDKYKLNVGFKPHPNNKPESKLLIKKIKNNFKHLNWIDPRVSNISIFNSGIKFGVSAYGTVLSELAYFDILPISCGDNPCSNYNFTFEAKNKNQYENILKNVEKLQFPKNYKNELGESIYMDKIYHSSMR
jgi:hypothetical protein